MREMGISHKQHPARREGKSLASLMMIKYCLASGKTIMIGASDIEACYNRIRLLYPEAKLTKHKGYVLVEKE